MFRSQLTAGGIDVVTVPGTQRRLDTMFHQNIIKVQSFFLIDGEIPVFIDLIVGNQVDIGIHAADQVRQLDRRFVTVVDAVEKNVFKSQTAVVVDAVADRRG